MSHSELLKLTNCIVLQAVGEEKVGHSAKHG